LWQSKLIFNAHYSKKEIVSLKSSLDLRMLKRKSTRNNNSYHSHLKFQYTHAHTPRYHSIAMLNTSSERKKIPFTIKVKEEHEKHI
jgi:hypothetical protein